MAGSDLDFQGVFDVDHLRDVPINFSVSEHLLLEETALPKTENMDSIWLHDRTHRIPAPEY